MCKVKKCASECVKKQKECQNKAAGFKGGIIELNEFLHCGRCPYLASCLINIIISFLVLSIKNYLAFVKHLAIICCNDYVIKPYKKQFVFTQPTK